MKAKHANLAMGLICCLFFLSCKKEKEPASEQQPAGNEIAKYNSIEQMRAEEDRTLAFTNLSPAEKAGFWNHHFSMQFTSLNKLQQVLLKEISAKITPALFDGNTNENAVFTSLIVPQWLQKSEPIFGKRKIINLFYFIEGIHETNEYVTSGGENGAQPRSDIQTAVEVVPPYGDDAPNCICNLSSSYTCVKNKWTGGTESSAETQTGSCSHNGSTCKYSRYGCGFVGLWACSGNACTY